MRTKAFFVVTLTSILCWADSSPADLRPFDFDNLDTDISDLKYDVQNGDLDDFFKRSEKKNGNNQQSPNKSENKQSGPGPKNKSSDTKGVKFDIENLKEFLKEIGLRDVGSYDDGAVYAIAEGAATAGLGVGGSEQKKYKKGTKIKGFHKISHKDEYNKNKEFYEDDETSGVMKRIGGKGLGFSVDVGGGVDRGFFHHNRDKGLYGREGFTDEGKLNKEYAAFGGFDDHFKSE